MREVENKGNSEFANKLSEIHKFLTENRKFNQAFQLREYNRSLKLSSEPKEQLKNLLFNINNSQSKPQLEITLRFWKWYYSKSICSFTDLQKALVEQDIELRYKHIYSGLEQQPGWGPKTAALFTKALYNLHCGYCKESAFLVDAPSFDVEQDELFIPVDAVIEHVFQTIFNNKVKNFNQINKVVKQRGDIDISVWDDLWFWGFINQNGTGNKRIYQWNEAKYWSQIETDKNPEIIATIKALSEDFRDIITS